MWTSFVFLFAGFWWLNGNTFSILVISLTMSNNLDYYAVLGLKRTATEDEIKKAFVIFTFSIQSYSFKDLKRLNCYRWNIYQLSCFCTLSRNWFDNWRKMSGTSFSASIMQCIVGIVVIRMLERLIVASSAAAFAVGGRLGWSRSSPNL